MPTYTFQCQECAAMLDVHRKMIDRDTPPEHCEACSATNLKRIQAASTFILNGTDWHNDTYNKHSRRKGR